MNRSKQHDSSAVARSQPHESESDNSYKIFLRLKTLSTYATWSHDAVSPQCLTNAGLSYTGVDDVVICNKCKQKFGSWTCEDNPTEKHLSRSPSCDFSAAIITDEDYNCTLSKCISILNRDVENDRDNNDRDRDRDCVDHQFRQNVRTSDSASSFNRECRELFDRAKTKGTTARIIDASNSESERTNVRSSQCQINRLSPNFDQLKSSEKLRLSTFYDWPASAALIVDAAQMSLCGLFYLGESDKVQCAFCQGILHSWEKGDRPDEEHRKYFPHCPLITEKSVDAETNDAERSHQNRVLLSQSRSSTSNDAAREQVDQATPVRLPLAEYTLFVDFESRCQSFRGKHVPEGQQPEMLALAGFFHVGPLDNVRCFQCGGGLKNWKSEDNPWIEHRRCFPECPYINICSDNEKATRFAAESRSQQVRQDARSTTCVKYRVEPREIKARMDSRTVHVVLELGFQRDFVRQAIEQRLRTEGDDFPSVASLVEAVLDIQEQQKTITVDAVVSAAASSTSASTSHTTVSTVGSNSQQVALPMIAQKPESATAQHCYGEDEETVSKLLEENRSLKERQACRVCMDLQTNTVFLPCGHLVCCDSCAKSLSKCPICRKFITGTVKVYSS